MQGWAELYITQRPYVRQLKSETLASVETILFDHRFIESVTVVVVGNGIIIRFLSIGQFSTNAADKRVEFAAIRSFFNTGAMAGYHSHHRNHTSFLNTVARIEKEW